MSVRILKGDCREILRSLDAESVQTCITSPPYWGLRDYGIQPSVWGGDPACDHEWGKQGQFCQICGAWAGAFGLEPTYQLYVDHAVEVFREVWRVLRPDGTLWLNLGDSYNAAGRVRHGTRIGCKQATNRGSAIGIHPSDATLKPKDLVGIPWRVAFALQADGWWLRSEIIWSKPNPMVESVRDRPTKAHEQVFLLAKSERYFYDADAVREPVSYPNGPNSPESIASPYGQGFTRRATEHRATFRGGCYVNGQPGKSTETGNVYRETDGRNARSVWTIATTSFPEAHFATFPPDLAKRCILAGCPAGGVVLDPFLGAGTTALVADRLGRSCVGIELNPEYADMATRRIKSDAGLFADVNHG